MEGNLSWQDALKRLQEGNKRFVEDHLDGKLQNSARRKELINEQNPFAIVLSCADSRVVPSFAFDTGLGELFVIRVAGNVANTSTIASIEYAMVHLGVNLIIVMGHENCGAITAAIQGGDNGENLNHLLDHIKPAIKASEDKSINAVVQENAIQTCLEIIRKSTIVAEELSINETRIIPAYYNLKSGKVDFLGL